MKFGPPESPKQVPPRLASWEVVNAKSPTKLLSMPLIRGVATMRMRSASFLNAAA